MTDKNGILTTNLAFGLFTLASKFFSFFFIFFHLFVFLITFKSKLMVRKL
jgi:hypothetical protein